MPRLPLERATASVGLEILAIYESGKGVGTGPGAGEVLS